MEENQQQQILQPQNPPTVEPAFRRLIQNKQRVVDRFAEECKKRIPESQTYSDNQIIDSLPYYLDRLAEALTVHNTESDANRGNTIAPIHGQQRAHCFRNYDVRKLMEEYEILCAMITEMFSQTGGCTIEEYEILSRSLWRGARESVYAFASDLQERRATAQKLFELLVGETKDFAIFMLDPTGKIMTWNEGAYRIKQFTAEEAIGRNFEFCYRPEDREAGRPESNLKLALLGGRHAEQWWRMKKDGTAFWADVTLTPVYENGRHIGFATVIHDLTQEKHNEDTLLNAKRSAEEASAMKNSFLANVSHEIRTPLNAILGFTEILRSRDLSDSERYRFIDIIDRNGRALVAIINDILDISKVEAGKLVIEKIAFDLRQLMAEVAGLFEGRALAKGIGFELEIRPPMPQYIVTDPGRFRQIVANIIGNAIKFTEKGKVSVTVDYVERERQLPQVRVTVRDTGVGIPKELQSKLFTPFSQADASTTRQFGGTGLGLALARKLARHMGGELALTECEHNRGCTFTILLADYISEASKETQEINKQRDMAPSLLRDRPHEKVDLSGVTILLVEDSRDNQLLVEKYLGDTGCNLLLACNGADGVDQAMKKNPDIILMDMQMPVLDGISATHKLREGGYKGPVIALTAHAMRAQVNSALEAGCNAHLAKPVSRTSLVDVILKHAQNQRH